MTTFATMNNPITNHTCQDITPSQLNITIDARLYDNPDRGQQSYCQRNVL